MDARQIPFEDEFDVIGAFDVLEHIVEDEACAWSKSSERSGPVAALLGDRAAASLSLEANDEHAMHQRRYRRAELREKGANEAGFRVERITSFVTLLLPLMMFSRTNGAKRQAPFNLWAEFEISRPLNSCLRDNALAVERALIRAGFSFPAGGSLLLVAKKTDTAS